MGWTGQSFRDFRCWYIAVFPPSLLIILSIIVLSVIITVCLLYILILRSAVKAVDKIREFKECSSNVAYINKAYEDDKGKEISKTTVTITVSTETVINKESLEMHELTKTNFEHKECDNGCRAMSRMMKTRYYSKSKTVKSSPTKLKAVRTVLLVTFCFVGTWAPYYVAVIMYVKCDIMIHGYDCIPLEVLTLGPLYLLGVSNSLCDPLIYAWRHSGFKRTLRKIYWKYIWKIKT